jgi:PBP1b-binding outer membrane lipoprotein LpoB
MKKVLGSIVVVSAIMLLAGCASKDAHSNDFAKNQLEEMKKPTKHRLSK